MVFPGVLTATEAMAAFKAGCDFAKIFPCAQVGGPTYIGALKASFPQIPLIASGGVNQQTAADYVRAGAAALGIGAAWPIVQSLRTPDGIFMPFSDLPAYPLTGGAYHAVSPTGKPNRSVCGHGNHRAQ